MSHRPSRSFLGMPEGFWPSIITALLILGIVIGTGYGLRYFPLLGA